VLRGVRSAQEWLALTRFCVVGASGYVINLLVFAAMIRETDSYRVAAVVAFCVAVTNNFVWNRGWTFRAGAGNRRVQAARFLVVSLAAFALSFVVLQLLVDIAHAPRVAAQATAILLATPASFVGNRLWTFRLRSPVGSNDP
jgi:putative flippase GtrA